MRVRISRSFFTGKFNKGVLLWSKYVERNGLELPEGVPTEYHSLVKILMYLSTWHRAYKGKRMPFQDDFFRSYVYSLSGLHSGYLACSSLYNLVGRYKELERLTDSYFRAESKGDFTIMSYSEMAIWERVEYLYGLEYGRLQKMEACQ